MDNKNKKKDKIISSLKFKLVLFFAIFTAAVFAALVVASFLQILSVTTELCARQNLPVAEKAAGLIDAEAFRRLAESLDKTDPYYASARLKMSTIKKEGNCLSLYAMALVTENACRYIIDGSENPDSHTFRPLGAEEDVGKFDEALVRAVKTGTPQFGKMNNKEPGWMLSVFMPIIDASDKTVGIICCDFEAESVYVNLRFQIIRQIILFLIFIAMGIALYIFLFNQVNLRNNHIAELEKESETASEAKNSFLANTSREIRAPVNAILGMAELLTRRDIPKDVLEEAINIKQAGSNLLAIVNDILDFSKIELGRLDIVKREYSLASLLKDIATITRAKFSGKDVTFNIHINNSLPANLYGDEARIRKVLLNLLSNAVKYTRKGSVSFLVTGEKEDDIVKMVFTVADTGIGIKEEDFPKLFGESIRFDSLRNHDTDGAGLGLAISRNLCRLMGGDITVSSVYGKGSSFVATIPQEIRGKGIITAETIITILSGKYSADTGKETDAQFTAPDAKLLVVDDIASNLMVMKGLLSSYEMIVETARSGKEALKMVASGGGKNQLYDIIFMDHMMPGMDGIEAAAAIRGFGEGYFQEIPIIAFSANTASETIEMFLEKGFNDCLSKPVDILKLDEILRKWLSASKIKEVQKEEKDPGAGNRGVELAIPVDILKLDEILRKWLSASKIKEVQKEEKDPGAGNRGVELAISGVDVEQGILMTGGDLAGYLLALAMFCKEADECLELLGTVPGEANLPVFVKQLRALKVASASLGALELSAEATKFESASKAGDTAVIREMLPGFAGRLTELTGNIRAVLDDGVAETIQGIPADLDLNEAIPLFEELVDVLKAKKIKGIDKILNNLHEKIDDPKIRKALEQISNEALISEYDKAIEIINALINKQ
ncbi:MAG: ATP-binding protein [Leptospirales bacterium]|nr:ATP-binding protein [Leptospirales bacterium]